jgi:hypothetical protein
MAAGLGFKTFTTGEVLTAADVNGYLMQGVLVFASEAARDAAITSPQEGQFAFTKDNNSLWYYSGAAWVASGATGDIEGVTAGTGISGGGTSGTVTITNSMATEITAKADLIVGTGNAAFDNLAVGTDGHVLTADSLVSPTGLKWAAPASGGGMTLINSGGTALSGATTTISSIPTTYNDLIIYIVDYYGSTDTNIHLRINSDATAANYQQFVNRGTGSSDGSYVTNGDAGMDLNGYSIDNVSNDNFATVYIPDYANTVSKKVANSMSGFVQTTGAKAVSNNTTYYAGSTLAITELAFRSSDGSGWSGGTVYVYGVK